MIACAGPTGLLPEQYDPLTERGLGNHPQAYSHLGLINCALLLDSVDRTIRMAACREQPVRDRSGRLRLGRQVSSTHR